MTEQLKAEAYVREQRPALMELTKGCILSKQHYGKEVFGQLLEKTNGGDILGVVFWFNGRKTALKELVPAYKIIGHPINLQDWLGVLWESNPNLEYTDAQMPLAKFGARAWYGLEKAPSDWIWFDAITGQPATQADYASFCAIMEL